MTLPRRPSFGGQQQHQAKRVIVAPTATDHEALTNARSQIGRGCSAILGGSALQQGQMQNQSSWRWPGTQRREGGISNLRDDWRPGDPMQRAGVLCGAPEAAGEL